MATHSSILAWRIPWTGESGELQSLGSQRVRYRWVASWERQTVKVLCVWPLNILELKFYVPEKGSASDSCAGLLRS